MKIRLVLAILFLVAAAILFGGYRDRTRNTSFLSIQPQASEAAVLRIMGTPTEIDRTCKAYDTQVTTNCDHVFVYKSSLIVVRSQYWLIFFDANNMATATSSQLVR